MGDDGRHSDTREREPKIREAPGKRVGQRGYDSLLVLRKGGPWAYERVGAPRTYGTVKEEWVKQPISLSGQSGAAPEGGKWEVNFKRTRGFLFLESGARS